VTQLLLCGVGRMTCIFFDCNDLTGNDDDDDGILFLEKVAVLADPNVVAVI